MKVCHMTSTHLPLDQRIFYKECVSLSNAGYEVYLIEQGNSLIESNVNIIGTGEQKKGRFYRLLVRPKKVYKLAKKLKADVYHFHDMELIPYGNKLSRKGYKVIFDYHEDYASRFSESDALKLPKIIKKMLAKIYASYEKRSLKKYAALISVTPHICDRLRKINDKTYMITNYPIIDSSIKVLDNKYCDESNYLAFAGQVSETYSLDTITKSIQEIPNIKFKICGPLRKNDYLSKLKSIDFNDKLEYIGLLNYKDVFGFLSNSRVAFVLSTYSSNTGYNIGTLGNNKLFEAMRCGIPVICTDYILWKDIISKYNCGICVSPDNSDEIKKAVMFLLENKDLAKKMGENGKNAVFTEFNWNTQSRVLLDIYKEI